VYSSIDPYLLSVLKKLDEKLFNQRRAANLKRYQDTNNPIRNHRFRGVTFRSRSEPGTDGYYAAYERQRARNRRRRKATR